MHPALIRAYVEALPRLRATEALTLASVIAAALGADGGEEQVAAWQREATGASKPEPDPHAVIRQFAAWGVPVKGA